MNRQLKIALKLVSNSLLILMIVLAILLVGVKLVGINVLTVLSPSMEPDYPTGSLIYLIEADPYSLEAEDVITYQLTETITATHRIKEIIPDENDPNIIRFRTKGDNNEDYDKKLVEMDQLVGKVIFCIPQLGRFAMYIQTPPGLYVAMGVALAIIFFVLSVDAIIDDKKHKTKSNQKGELQNEET